MTIRAGGNAEYKGTVIVVEDNLQILDAVSLVLECHGWRVLTFDNGEEFLEGLSLLEPDCILLDPHLPGINGAEVVRRITRPDSLKPLSIIILTAHPGSDEIALLQQQGISQVLLKPVTEAALLEALEPFSAY